MSSREIGARSVVLDEDNGTFTRYDLGAAQPGDMVGLTTDRGKYDITKAEAASALSGWELDGQAVSVTLGDGTNRLHSIVLKTGHEIMVTREGENVLRSLGQVAELRIRMEDNERN